MSTTTIERYGTSCTNIATMNPEHLIGISYPTPSGIPSYILNPNQLTIEDAYQLIRKLEDRVTELENKLTKLNKF
jgi:hypothetical protein